MLKLAESSPNGAAPDTALAEKVEMLNARYRHHSATAVMQGALQDAGQIALVSSFGAESVVLLHMAAVIDPAVPVLFVDTELLFTETLVYQQEVSERLGLRNVQVIRAEDIAEKDPYGALRFSDTDACCHLRKTVPLQNALSGYDGWITGRKRFQSGSRAALDFFEVEDGTGRIKVNPLAHWAPEDVRAYMEENRLPRHPLVAQGYPSIGCAPCTSKVAEGEDPRAGRWRDQNKEECGIHIVDGKLTRKGADPK
ncbi:MULTISPECIES: phosphoadenylyl-sulfate reductase [Rhodobacterales]|jgi:phosphoadenosine phosphosulfate reductase|uniref:phosphoadenylyl-sulfate reductase n=1 Tax=Rhodobacterales TaxID=204455 RepID=UPI00237F4C11|nr:phosphoadenylyl-sulfate reductase [Phaeobacter gallaeciensis]MDE4096027.1 phosphoadenylyl-sulfate reductase [Phaeobacter gallaeciensis]MDE4104838.1 phosphoadenylyl-sulfate reductase [Phaeobacter gallaeciensis]MDE4109294.1 phosphoadenylyl-sulfate reductase [Phaeobacter gallaeciensis]MDE4113762.1 phosphoadenylyl-sulfate reductase [Phaeobacter gallaeciensis]MDE4118230.1 phosphoadenylyl-sulfate reductase [Phaeobacter gallaeciensis]